MPVLSLPPVFTDRSEKLILGSFPSVRSREVGFYYGHPRNRFWPLMAALFSSPLPGTTEEKRLLLERNRLALWDVTASCEITGSADSSIRSVIPNEIAGLLNAAPFKAVYLNGKTAERLWLRFCAPTLPRTLPVRVLPSTSPANASFSFEALLAAWRCLTEDIC